MGELIDKFFNLPELQKEVQSAYDEVIINFDDYVFEDDRAEYSILTVCSGSAGTYQPKEIIEGWEIEVEEGTDLLDPENWDWYIYPFFNKVSDELNEAIKLEEQEGYDFNIYFGHHDADGGFDLFIGVEKTEQE